MHKYRHFYGLPRSMGRERAAFLFFFNKNSRNLQGQAEGEHGGLRRAGWRWLGGMPRCVRLLRSVRSSSAALRLVRARAAPPFVVRRSSFVRRCSRRVPSGSPGRAGFARVPFSGVPPPRAVARLPLSLPRSSLLSLACVLLSPRARRPPLSLRSAPSLRAASPRATASHRAAEGCAAAETPRTRARASAPPPRTAADSRRTRARACAPPPRTAPNR